MSATSEFFDRLAEQGTEPLLERASGTVRFDLRSNGKTERWLVTLDKGDVTVSHRNVAADCTIRGDRAVFDRIAAGQDNPVAAVLRGALELEGDWRLMVLFRRVLGAEKVPA